jgi:hypothetical protein
VQPKVLLQDAATSEPEVCQHSYLLITSATWQQYVADFTLEQFGFETEMWFCVCEEYEAMSRVEWCEEVSEAFIESHWGGLSHVDGKDWVRWGKKRAVELAGVLKYNPRYQQAVILLLLGWLVYAMAAYGVIYLG